MASSVTVVAAARVTLVKAAVSFTPGMVLPEPLRTVQLALLFQLLGVVVVFHSYTVCARAPVRDNATSRPRPRMRDMVWVRFIFIGLSDF